MDRELKRYPYFVQILLPLLLLIGILYGCANRVAPGGGPYDETPPVLVRSMPEDRALNVNKKRVVLYFDEYIQVKDISTKVIISPPQIKQPKIMGVGKRVIVDLEDNLLPNTTYTLDFTDAIVDNNEGNPLENFSFAFSTGNEIDTMEVSGKVLSMRNHEPVQGVLVGIHPDSAGWNAFTDTTFLRMSRTSDKALFVMRNIKPGSYRIYALKENDGNYRHDMPNEGVAFLDSLITTRSMASIRQDTLWVDSLTIDTIKQVPYTRYLPDDLVLMYYEPETKRRFISKRERPDSMQLKLTFNLPLTDGLKITPYDSMYIASHTSFDSIPPYHLDQDEKGEVRVFFTNPAWKRYNHFEFKYTSTDSLDLPLVAKDSLVLKVSAPKREERNKKSEQDTIASQKAANPFTLRVEHKGHGGIADSILFTTSLPIDTTAFKGVELYNANDSILKPIEIQEIKLLPGRSTVGIIRAKLSYNTSYELYFDSLKFVSVYGDHLDQTVIDAFKTQSKEEFAQLEIVVHGVEGPFIAELLNTQDAPVRVLYSDSIPSFKFADLKPDKYAFRLILDRNGNKLWDPGSYKDSIQPEMVYYAPKIFEVMKNWSVTENIYPLQTPLDQQKPREMIKNKPKEVERKNRNQEREEEMKRRNQGQPSGFGGMGGLGGLGGSSGMDGSQRSGRF